MKSRGGLRVSSVVVVCVLVSIGAISQAQTPSFQGIGGSFGYNSTSAAAVSADGSAIAGDITSDWIGGGFAFRWTPSSGVVYIGRQDGAVNGQNTACDISGDGTLIVGKGTLVGAPGFLWQLGAGFVASFPVCQAPSTGLKTSAISASGLVVAGNDCGQFFRWSFETGVVHLGDGFAWDISADGSAIVGYSGSEAFRWTEETGMVGLGDLAGGGSWSRARAVSADGSVVVGEADSQAWRWTAGTGMVGLGCLPGDSYSQAYAVSEDGSVIVGTSYDGGGAFVWDPVNGMRALRDVLIGDFGLDLAGWWLARANDITPDGHTIVGDGINPDGRAEGWIAVIPDLVRTIVATIDIDPDVLTLRSAIPQITCYIRLPAGYSVASIDRNSVVLLEGQVHAASVQIDAKKQVATAKFDRSAISDILVPGEVKLTITGKLPDRTVFVGVGTMTVRK